VLSQAPAPNIFKYQNFAPGVIISMVLVCTGHAISEKFATVLYCLKTECASTLTAG
jgi:hypothetical protein